MDILYLDETQNAAFDADYHGLAEMQAKLARLAILANGAEFSVLDVGGGNGRFLDSILDQFPNASGTLFDISPGLIALNKPHPRKTLLIGSVADLDRAFPPQTFDIITINWLLHHLVASSYTGCAENCRDALMKCAALLKPNGVVVVSENMFDGFAGCNLPSWIIYRITSFRAPWFVSLARPYFNTSGIGVCFRSARAWRKVFREAGMQMVYDDQGESWPMTIKRHLLFPILAIQRVSHRHFYLRPRRAHWTQAL